MKELIKITQMPVISYDSLEVASAIVDKTIASLDLENQLATADTIKKIKEIRASLNKGFNAYEEQRKAVKNAIVKPYQDFEMEYKRFISDKLRRADEILKEKILFFENDLKIAKEGKMVAYFVEKSKSLNIDFVKFAQVGLNITLSASEKSLKGAIDTFIDGISSEIKTIEVLPEDVEFKTEVMVEYRTTLDLNHSIKIIQDRRKAKEAELAKAVESGKWKVENEEGRPKSAEGSQEPNTESPQRAEPLKAPTVETEKPKEYEATFTVKGTMAQLQALKAFIVENNIQIIK